MLGGASAATAHACVPRSGRCVDHFTIRAPASSSSSPDLELARSSLPVPARSSSARRPGPYAENGDAVAITKLFEDHQSLIEQISEGGLLPEHLAPLQSLEDQLTLARCCRKPAQSIDRNDCAPAEELFDSDQAGPAHHRAFRLRTLREHMEILKLVRRATPTEPKPRWAVTSQAALQRILGMVV